MRFQGFEPIFRSLFRDILRDRYPFQNPKSDSVKRKNKKKLFFPYNFTLYAYNVTFIYSSRQWGICREHRYGFQQIWGSCGISHTEAHHPLVGHMPDETMSTARHSNSPYHAHICAQYLAIIGGRVRAYFHICTPTADQWRARIAIADNLAHTVGTKRGN